MRNAAYRRLVRGAFRAIRRWVSLMLIAWVASRISRELAMALYTEALNAGWYDAAQ